ncbi:hypothetical protein BDV06DRAFT_234051 [Aspergillus oleicola]
MWLEKVDQIRASPNPDRIKSTIFEGILSSALPESEKTNARLAHEAQLIVFAGQGTTAYTLSAAIYQLLANPAEFKKAKDELVLAIPDPNVIPSYSQIECLPYFQAALQEVLRLHPGVVSRLPRVSPNVPIIYTSTTNKSTKSNANETTSTTFIIPPGTPTSMSAPITHMNGDIFENPTDFIPQRWIDNPRLDRAFIGFARGTRNCIGMNFARQQMSIMLASIIRKYDIYHGQEGPTLELYDTRRERDIDLSNHNGRTAGIASPDAEAQAIAIRAAYTNAGISDFGQTAYLECHGTGTQAGDATEVRGLASVFSGSRTSHNPLIIGSVKSNIGHSEPAAGLSGLIKAVLAVEKGAIPGNPTFVDPSPKIDFAGSKVKASRSMIEWPKNARRRASVNSFGIGGSNAHAIVEHSDDFEAKHTSSYLDVETGSTGEEQSSHSRPLNLVLSAANASSLRANIRALCSHLLNPGVKVDLEDLAYTLSERRTRLFHRAFVTASNTNFGEDSFIIGKKTPQPPKIGLVFTGQGAQWPEMGKQLIEAFPWLRELLNELDQVLQNQSDAPKWSLVAELTEIRTAEHMRQPEISQPLVTALQLCLLAVLETWDIRASCVVGHSSGECAAAYAAGWVDRAGALKAAFYRGRAAANCAGEVEDHLGMLALGLGADEAAHFVQKHAGNASVACFNSPSSISEEVRAAGHFARLLHVDMAYHSEFMGPISNEYLRLLDSDSAFRPLGKGASDTPTDSTYWRSNMVLPVKFGDALKEMVLKESPEFLVEIGPANSLSDGGENTAYFQSLLGVAGRLFVAGTPIDLARVNRYTNSVRTIIDLPNYSWNHATKYWHETAASKDWRFRKFPVHDLLGSKVLGTSWHAPTFRHRLDMGGNAIMPAAGHCTLNPNDAPASANELCYRFRHVRFERALVLESGKDAQLILTLNRSPHSKIWHEFRISTTSESGIIVEHCLGHIRIHDAVEETLSDMPPLKYPQPPARWYKANRAIGMEFGPTFQRLLAIQATSGVRACRTLISMVPPASCWTPQSSYPIHPAALDGCLQTPIPANASGDLDDIIINRVPAQLQQGLASATSVYSGRGRLDADKSWIANTVVHDSETGSLLVSITGDLHTFMHGGQLMQLHPGDQLGHVLDLIAHGSPGLKVLEVNLDEADASSLWFDGFNPASPRFTYSRYDLALADGELLVAAQGKFQQKRNTSVLFLSSAEPRLSLPAAVGYDLAILKAKQLNNGMDSLAAEVRHALTPNAIVVVVQGAEDAFEAADTSPQSRSSTASSNSESWVDLDKQDHYYRKGLGNLKDQFNHVLEISTLANTALAYLLTNGPAHPQQRAQQTLMVAGLRDCACSALSLSLQEKLAASGWSVTVEKYPYPKPADGTIVLVLDELVSPILRNASNKQWDAIKSLVTSSSTCPLLWTTRSAQDTVADPDNGLVHGLFRAARREDNSLKLTTLDVQASTGPTTDWAIDSILRLLRDQPGDDDTPIETEYMERDGIIHTQRLIPAHDINDLIDAENNGLDPVRTQLFNRAGPQIQLRAEHVGTLDGLTWCESDTSMLPLDADHIEIEVVAAGVNFKDVAITMGIVPDNEYSLGFECAGVVRRLANGVTKFKVGDRVCALNQGCYANRVRFHAGRCHAIPSTMSYEDAATIPSVYVCSLYALYHLAGLREGQSVLIHSATGGIGIACIELARYKKAEIYVTAGTEEKRRFLHVTYNIPESRIFSSRNTGFAEGILRETGGRGVDAIVNSLVGELLDASWRIVAAGGTMVEIGKRDIVDHNTLAMEPFDRNCSFRAVDVSFKRHFDDALVSRLLDELFILINAGHLKPIRPITRFPFDALPEALAHIRRHMGKLVISRRDDADDIEVPVRPAVCKLQLRSDVSYLLVGGLRGACGTLAICMAQHGARHLVVCSRSGIADERSCRIVEDCLAYGCTVTEARVDVGDLAALKRVFQSTQPRIAGVVQGAMVLKDKPYETMTHLDYHITLHSKVQGTWNLHHASLDLPAPLDFFTLLSSISGVIGNGGQANYASANTFLDAFAGYRQSLGLCASAIDLGALEDVGVIAEEKTGILEAKFDKRLFVPISERMLRRILVYSVMSQIQSDGQSQGRCHGGQLSTATSTSTIPRAMPQLITGITYPLNRVAAGSLARDARLSYLIAASAAIGDRDSFSDALESSNGSDKIEQSLRAMQTVQASGAETAAVKKACVAVLCGQIGRILRLADDEVEPGKSLMAYGVDSLSAVELRNWIRMKMRVELTTLDIVNASSLIALAGKIVTKMTGAGDHAYKRDGN